MCVCAQRETSCVFIVLYRNVKLNVAGHNEAFTRWFTPCARGDKNIALVIGGLKPEVRDSMIDLINSKIYPEPKQVTYCVWNYEGTVDLRLIDAELAYFHVILDRQGIDVRYTREDYGLCFLTAKIRKDLVRFPH